MFINTNGLLILCRLCFSHHSNKAHRHCVFTIDSEQLLLSTLGVTLVVPLLLLLVLMRTMAKM